MRRQSALTLQEPQVFRRLGSWLLQCGQTGVPRGVDLGGRPIEEHFTLHSPALGEGSFGVVHRATRVTPWRRGASPPVPPGADVALKTIYRNKASRHEEDWAYHTAVEIAVLRNLSHPNLPVLHDVFLGADAVYIAMGFRPDSDTLYAWINEGPRPADATRTVLGQLLVVLAYIHDNGVVHRDLKPDNILINRSTLVIKLIDFGLSRHIASPPSAFPDWSPVGLEQDPYAAALAAPPPSQPVNFSLVHLTPVGAELYRAQELQCRRRRQEEYLCTLGYNAYKVDVYGAGVIAYAMLCRSLPFYPANWKELQRKGLLGRTLVQLMRQGVKFPSTPIVPKEAKALVTAMLSMGPDQRPCAFDCMDRDFMRGFQHPLGADAGRRPSRAPHARDPTPGWAPSSAEGGIRHECPTCGALLPSSPTGLSCAHCDDSLVAAGQRAHRDPHPQGSPRGRLSPSRHPAPADAAPRRPAAAAAAGASPPRSPHGSPAAPAAAQPAEACPGSQPPLATPIQGPLDEALWSALLAHPALSRECGLDPPADECGGDGSDGGAQCSGS